MSTHYPRHLQKLAVDLAMAATYMRGYLGHQGVIGKNHPLSIKLDDANKAFQQAQFDWEQRCERAKKKQRR